MDQWGVDQKVARMTNALHSGSWMRFEDADAVVQTTGGRQGCKLGGVVFGAIYAQAIKRVRQRLFLEGLHLHLPCVTSRQPWCQTDGEDTNTHSQGRRNADIIDVTFGDDEAIMLAERTPVALSKAITLLLEAVTATFVDFGLQLNWRRGKSEMMVQFTGKHAVRQLELLRTPEGGLAFLLPDGFGDHVLHIVDHYKHLGATCAWMVRRYVMRVIEPMPHCLHMSSWSFASSRPRPSPQLSSCASSTPSS